MIFQASHHLLLSGNEKMTLDSGNTIDWGKTSDDYSLYRSGMPDSYFRKLSEHGIGEEKQKILDLGTGTGNLAREFSRNGSIVSGIDISEEQILMAQKLMHEQDLNIDFQVSSAESLPFNDDSFDCATANQCFLYFDTNKALAEIKRVLKPNGLLMLSHFSWLPRIDAVARESEKLVLKYNPNWGSKTKWIAADFDGVPPPYYKLSKLGLAQRAMFFYDVRVPFTKESWRGRIRACRGIGASLTEDEVKKFDKEHQELLDSITDDSFSILHRIDIQIFSFNGYESSHEI